MSGARKVSDDDSVSREMMILNRQGIHARPSALFVKTASKYECDIFVEKDGEEVNGKSIMGVMMLAAECGSEVHLKAEGPDADEAVAAIASLIANKFGEH